MHVIYNTVITNNNEIIAEIDHRVIKITNCHLYTITSDLLFNFSFDIYLYEGKEINKSVELFVHNHGALHNEEHTLFLLLKKYHKKLLKIVPEDEHDIDQFVIKLLPLFELIETLHDLCVDQL